MQAQTQFSFLETYRIAAKSPKEIERDHIQHGMKALSEPYYFVIIQCLASGPKSSYELRSIRGRTSPKEFNRRISELTRMGVIAPRSTRSPLSKYELRGHYAKAMPKLIDCILSLKFV